MRGRQCGSAERQQESIGARRRLYLNQNYETGGIGRGRGRGPGHIGHCPDVSALGGATGVDTFPEPSSVVVFCWTTALLWLKK